MAPGPARSSAVPDESATPLAVAVDSFVGREDDVELTQASLHASRLVTITGAGGIGKTRLAREVATQAGEGFTDGARTVALASVHLDDEVDETVVDALRLAPAATGSVTEQLIEYLADRHLLLVVDNCEHLLSGCRRLIAEILARTRCVHVLATSREALGIAGERVVLLRPLTTPDPGPRTASIEQVRSFGAIRLLEDRAVAVQSRFRIDQDNADAAVALTTALDGLPLAIELAAARLRSLSLPELTERLDDRFTMLNRGDPTARTHHQTLRAMVEGSWDLCTAGERRLWAALSVFSGGADLQAVDAVLGSDAEPGLDLLDVLDGLVAKSVVQAETSGRRTRYSMLETMIAFGREKTSEYFPDPDVLATRHAHHYLGLAERGRDNFYTADQLAWTRLLRAERANLTAAFDHLMATEPRTALQLATALRFHWLAGPLREGRRWLDDALDATSEPDAERLAALMASVWIAAAQGDQTHAAVRAAEIETVVAVLDLPVWTRRARLYTGIAAQLHGELEEADRAFDEVRTTSDGPDDLEHVILASAVQLLGCFELAQPERARAIYSQFVALCDERGERWMKSYAQAFHSFGAWLVGDIDEAEQVAGESLRVKIEFEDPLGSAMLLGMLAAVAFRRGDAERAAALFGRAAVMNRAIGVTSAAYTTAMDGALTAVAKEVHDALGGAGYHDAFTRGGLMSQSEWQLLAAEAGRPVLVPPTGQPVLTDREREVAVLVSRGMSNRQIAERLVLSPRTIDGHLERIFGKLTVRSRAEVAAWVATRA